jgi:hypothetical protein
MTTTYNPDYLYYLVLGPSSVNQKIALNSLFPLLNLNPSQGPGIEIHNYPAKKIGFISVPGFNSKLEKPILLMQKIQNFLTDYKVHSVIMFEDADLLPYNIDFRFFLNS